MTKLEKLEKRVSELEAAFEAQAGVVNYLLETCFAPEFIAKLDKLAKKGIINDSTNK